MQTLCYRVIQAKVATKCDALIRDDIGRDTISLARSKAYAFPSFCSLHSWTRLTMQHLYKDKQ